MAYIISGVSSYHYWDKKGTVINQITGEPRTFETKEAAKQFCDLSQYKDATITQASAR